MLGELIPDLVSTAFELTVVSNSDPPSGARYMDDSRK